MQMGTKSRQKKMHIYQTNTVTKDIEDHYTVIKGSRHLKAAN